MKEETKQAQVKSVWEYYGTDKGIMEFAEYFNVSKHNVVAGGGNPTSPPLKKIKYQDIQIQLGSIWNFSIFSMLTSTLIWNFFKESMLKPAGMASINDLLIGTGFVSLLVLSGLSMIAAISTAARGDRKDLRTYLEKFEKLGGRFANTILANSPVELPISERCNWVLRLKAECVLINPQEAKRLRDEINEIIDIMLESKIINQSKVHTQYTRAFEEAQAKIEKQKTVLRTP